MTFRRFVLTFLLPVLVTLAGSAPAAELHGKVAVVNGRDVQIRMESEHLPQPGDEVTIGFLIPDGPMVVVGTWKVTSIEGETVLATQVDATGTAAVGQLAKIASANPVPRPARQTAITMEPAFGDNVPVRYQGQTYMTLYQYQMDPGGIDLYFFKAADAGPDEGGNPRYNRFVRDPSETNPGSPTWWFCRWEQQNGSWTYVQTKVDGVTVGHTPVHPAAYEGSTWNTTSYDAVGERKGQTFTMAMKVSTTNGVTRMTGPTLYLEGRIMGDRYTFTTFNNDGTRTGEGFCVFSGNVLSGGWTATNGRAGRWEGRRVP